jgi:hypothetical protein
VSRVRLKVKPSAAINDVLVERVRQLTEEGYDALHDDQHDDGALAMAAACYAAPHRIYQKRDFADGVSFADPWPPGWRGDKRPHEGNVVRSNGAHGEPHRRSLLVKAAALILAELFAVRLFRSEQDVTPLGASPETQAKIQEWEQIDREDTARRAAADAAAIMAAVSVVKL